MVKRSGSEGTTKGERVNAHRRVIDTLAIAIVAGKFREGEQLPKEIDLVTTYNISRSALRESMKVLAAKGIIESRRKAGTFVRSRSNWNIFDNEVLAWHHAAGMGKRVLLDFLEIRSMVEPAAARMAAATASLKDLALIGDALARMAENIGSDEEFAVADAEFHGAILTASRNLMFIGLSRLIVQFLLTCFRIQNPTLDRAGDWRTEDVEHHRLVFEAIQSGEEDLAGERMRQVVLRGKRSLIEALG